MTIWHDTKIIQASLGNGAPLVVPFTKDHVNPGSYDLMLGDKFRRPHTIWSYLDAPAIHMLIEGATPWQKIDAYHANFGEDPNIYTLLREGKAETLIDRLPKWGDEQTLAEGEGFWLLHGEFVLCHSVEYVNLPIDTISFLFSKSSTGRVGLEHLHAGLGDAGWEGQWVFEFHNVAPWPLFLRSGRRIMQMVVLDMLGRAAESYKTKGKYDKQMGTVPSRNKEV